MSEPPKLDCYIVAQVDGRRVLIPVLFPELEMKLEHPEPTRFSGSGARQFPGPGVMRVRLEGEVPKYFVWEGGKNPEDLRPDELDIPMLQIDPIPTPERTHDD